MQNRDVVDHCTYQVFRTVSYNTQVEGVAARRGYHSSTEQTFDRILSTLLVEMDGVSEKSFTVRGGCRFQSLDHVHCSARFHATAV